MHLGGPNKKMAPMKNCPEVQGRLNYTQENKLGNTSCVTRVNFGLIFSTI